MRSVLAGAGLALAAGALAGGEPGGGAVRELEVRVQTPSPCWGVAITGVYATGDRLLVVARMRPPPAGLMCAQVVGEARDSVRVAAPELPVAYRILGHPWGGPGDPGYAFPASRAALEAELAGARRLTPRE